jgi:pimeloyl-ACP methyl ester carboxylesterase
LDSGFWLLDSKKVNKEVVMANITTNNINIEYETFGKKSSPPLLLIMGLGAQMIFWDDDFCSMLAEKDHYVIRFDNRDIGLSTKFENAGVPDIMQAMNAVSRGEKVSSPYSIDDMADDAAGLLDSLGIEKSNICGASMGGMIAQTIAIRHPSKVLGLISIMSSTGDPGLPQAKPEAMNVLMMPAPKEREANIEFSVKTFKIIGSTGFPFDEARMRKKAEMSFDRAFYPQGMARQLLAIIAHGDRTSKLKAVSKPTLVIHGSADPLVPVEAGKATARAIPGARLLIIEGMGHDLPSGSWPQIIDAIYEITHK